MRVLQALKPADMASLFHVLGLFGFDFEAKPELLGALLPRAEALLPNMKPFEVTSLYWGLGMTRQVTNSLFADLTAIVRRLQQQQSAAQARLQELQEQHAVQQQPAAGDGDGDAVSQQQHPEQQQQQQRRSGKQQLPQTPEVAQLQARARQLPDSLQRQAFQAFIAARMEGAPVELPVDVLSALQSAWLASSRHSAGSGGSSSYARGGRALQPLLLELEWLLGALRIKARVGVRSKLDKLVPVDVELLASGQRCVALQVLDEHEVARDGTRLATVAWEEDVLRRNGYDDVHWLRVADYKRVPKERRPRYIGDLLRKLGISPQERLLAAAERAWLEAGCKPGGGGSGGSSSGGSWGDKAGAGGISAAEADVLMQGGSGGGWAMGGRGTRSRRGSPPSGSGKRR
jgi:hypothetical protein